jgi:glutathione S-transferase
MLKIWGRISSINVCKAVFAIQELGLKYERYDVGGKFGGLDTPDYVAMNPNSKIPTIDDDGFILWESNTIIRYLAARHGAGTLWPTDARERADSDRWMDWQCTEFNPALTPAFWGLIRTAPEQRNLQAIADAAAKTGRMAQVLDKVLAKQQYLAGDRFTMGDVAVGCAVDRWFMLPMERPDVPHLLQWRERVAARPAAQGVLKQPLS